MRNKDKFGYSPKLPEAIREGFMEKSSLGDQS